MFIKMDLINWIWKKMLKTHFFNLFCRTLIGLKLMPYHRSNYTILHFNFLRKIWAPNKRCGQKYSMCTFCLNSKLKKYVQGYALQNINIHRLKNTKIRFSKKSNADFQELWLISTHYIKCAFIISFLYESSFLEEKFK